MGKQSLYNVHITVDVKGYGESDAWSHLFGFRKTESHIDNATGKVLLYMPSRTFYVGFYFDTSYRPTRCVGIYIIIGVIYKK